MSVIEELEAIVVPGGGPGRLERDGALRGTGFHRFQHIFRRQLQLLGDFIYRRLATEFRLQPLRGNIGDCDRDAVVIRVHPKGPACHTGARSCFFEEVEGFRPHSASSIGAVLGELERVIRDRKLRRPEGSYTARLFERGRNRILQKVGEEATETVVAAMSGDRSETIKEASDLLFHLLVALVELDIPLEDVAAELESRRK